MSVFSIKQVLQPIFVKKPTTSAPTPVVPPAPAQPISTPPTVAPLSPQAPIPITNPIQTLTTADRVTPLKESALPQNQQQKGAKVGLTFDWQQQEIQNTAQVSNDLIELFVPSGNLNRKVYCYIYANAPGGNYSVSGEIALYRNGAIKARIPMGIGGGVFPDNTSKVSLCVSGLDTQDAIGLYLTNPQGTQPTTGIVLTPFYINGDFDKATFNLLGLYTATYIRVFMGIVSLFKNQPEI